MNHFRTDRDRFLDPDYVASILYVIFGVAQGPYTALDKAQFEDEKRQFIEYYKGGFDILNNLVALGINARMVIEYNRLLIRAGSNAGGVRELLRYTLQFCQASKSGATFIESVATHSGQIGDRLASMKTGSLKFLGFLVCIQVGVHAMRGDYAKCLAEVTKAAFSLAFPPVAFLDLVDSILGLFLPEWVLKQPTMRVVRGMNPASCSFAIVENMCWIVYIGTLATQRHWDDLAKAVNNWATAMEKSPMGIYTSLSRDTALLFDEYVLPGSWSRVSVFGASIHDLADYARAHPSDY